MQGSRRTTAAICLVISLLMATSSFAEDKVEAPAAATPVLRPVSVLVSDDTVSTWTETPSGDTLLKDSQVFVGGKSTSPAIFGLLGVAVDRARNSAAAGPAGASIALKFADDLRALISSPDGQAAYALIAGSPASGSYDIKLLPSARFGLEDQQKVSLSFRLTARFRDANGNESTKNYYRWVSDDRPLAGDESWSANDGALLRDAAKKAFGLLLTVMAHDREGRYAKLLANPKANSRQFRYRNGVTFTAVVLEDMQTEWVMSPSFKDRVYKTVINVGGKDFAQIDGP